MGKGEKVKTKSKVERKNPRPWALNFKAVLVAICLLLLASLTACTGSSELGVPTLLVVAYGEGDSKLALVEDKFFTDGPSFDRFVFVTELDLPGTVLDYDVVDRRGERSVLVVLGRSDTDYTLSIVNMAGIDPEDGATAFRVTRTVELSSLTDAPAEFAPVRVQVNQSGRYTALLNDPNSADDRDGSVVVLDLEATGGPAFIVPDDPLDDSVYDKVLYLDQSEDPERIYFLSEEASGQKLRYAELPDLELTEPDITVPDSISSDVRDLGLIGDAETGALVALQSNQFTPITLRPNLLLGEPVSTTSNAELIVPNNSAAPDSLMMIGSTDITVHRTLQTAADNESRTVIDGNLEPFSEFVYFVQDSAAPLLLFDLRRYDSDEAADLSNFLSTFNVLTAAEVPGEFVELPDPVFVTWAKAVLPATP